ncbi:MAG: imidazolonepropionase [Actinomycetota bacterium]|nr:imidazolonepropionase [Actinomycetota bacterium]
MTTTVWMNATLATMRGGGYGLVRHGAIACTDGDIVAAGSVAAVLGALPTGEEATEIDLDGRLVMPGLIDCHTHLVFAGSRADEFERRIAGATYAEIADSGGGILSTVSATRAASEDELVAAATPRLDALLADGVTTVEIKSGYGLASDAELTMLRAAGRLRSHRQVSVVRTLLAAHTVPAEFAGRADEYLDIVCEEIIPAAAAGGLADHIDVFCERIGFGLAQTRRVAEAARRHRLPVKGHTEQLSWLGGSALLARAGALSIDHGEYLRPDDVAVLAEHGTVVVLLPGACYFTGEHQRPPVQLLRRAGVPMAVATDMNPGTSPLASLRLAANQACVTFGLTVPEAMHAVTSVAARALGLVDRGRLEPGLRADLAIWDVEHPAELIYEPLTPRLHERVVEGLPARLPT